MVRGSHYENQFWLIIFKTINCFTKHKEAINFRDIFATRIHQIPKKCLLGVIYPLKQEGNLKLKISYAHFL